MCRSSRCFVSFIYNYYLRLFLSLKKEITEDKVNGKIKELNPNKSQDPDSFHPRVIKEAEAEITPHLCNIYRTSLEQKKAVTDWKIQNIAPVHKKSSKDEPGTTDLLA